MTNPVYYINLLKKGNYLKFSDLGFKSRGYVYFHFSFVMVLFYIFLFKDNKPSIVWYIPGVILIIFGEFMRLWSASYIGTCGRKSSLDVKDLRTTGPYSFVRNPIYLGNFIWALGFAFLSKLFFLIPYFFGWLILLYIFIIPHEEKYLLDNFGDEYRDYCKRKPRIIPTFKNIEKGRYSISKGLTNELHVLNYHVVTISIFTVFAFIRGGFDLF